MDITLPYTCECANCGYYMTADSQRKRIRGVVGGDVISLSLGSG